MEPWSSLGQLSYQVSNLDDRVGGGFGNLCLDVQKMIVRSRHDRHHQKGDARFMWMMKKQGRLCVEACRTVSQQSGFCCPKLTNDGDLTKHSRCRYALPASRVSRSSIHLISVSRR
jgi:hypothetical protein